MGIEGLNKIQSSPDDFAVVLLDQLLPEMSGADALARIKSIDPTIPVIITGVSTPALEKQLKELGAFACLLKPFIPDQLREAVNEAART